MSYKPNFGNSYDHYGGQNNLGYSNVSRSYNKVSARSMTQFSQMEQSNMVDMVNLNLCWRMSVKSLDRPKIVMKPI